MRLASLLTALPLLLTACASDDGSPRETRRLQGSLADCVNVMQVCAETFPEQCFDYCADENPQPGDPDCGVVSPDDPTTSPDDPGEPTDVDVVECDDQPCILTEADGQDIQICYPPDCAVAYDAETGTETISCPPSGGGGGEPGDPGEPTDPTEPCDAAGGGGFVKYPEGSCGNSDDGVCTLIAEVCPEIWGPVCGCDGQTYANDCFADGAAVSVAHQGECDGTPLPL